MFPIHSNHTSATICHLTFVSPGAVSALSSAKYSFFRSFVRSSSISLSLAARIQIDSGTKRVSPHTFLRSTRHQFTFDKIKRNVHRLALPTQTFRFSMQSTCSPLLVHELFRSLLSGAVPPDTAMASQPSPTNTSPRLTSPPKKNTIRFISNDPHNRREKYDGSRWRRVCTWNECLCTNLAYSNLLCARHNTQQRNREWQTKQGKAIAARVSLPISKIAFVINPLNGIFHSSVPRPNYERMHSDDDIEILEELCQVTENRAPSSSRHLSLID